MRTKHQKWAWLKMSHALMRTFGLIITYLTNCLSKKNFLDTPLVKDEHVQTVVKACACYIKFEPDKLIIKDAWVQIFRKIRIPQKKHAALV